jgi:2-polyprenyl-6-methoxyphenol hydroxylase-like FAD-dependent oxidoreductase
MTIDIIGAGIGGLTTALALEQKGFKTRIYEQSEKIIPVGAGIILAINAMQVFDKLGLKEIIEKNGNPISTMNITDSNLIPLSKINYSPFEKKHKVKTIAIHRGTLQQILIDHLKSSSLFLNYKLKRIDKIENGHSLEFQNGKFIKSDILIAADGINSIIRQSLFPNTILRHANQICWRGITEYQLPQKYQNQLNEVWGKSERFGFVKIAKDKVYWYALKSLSKDKTEPKPIGNNFFEHRDFIKKLVSSTDKKQIHIAEITDLKPTKNWSKENICLIGDAAHATTPNMGQGACQAIEDAFVLSECLSNYDTNMAFKNFEELRISKAHHVVKSSWMIGKIAHLSNPILISIRNQLIRMTPISINKKQSEKLFELTQV